VGRRERRAGLLIEDLEAARGGGAPAPEGGHEGGQVRHRGGVTRDANGAPQTREIFGGGVGAETAVGDETV